MNLKKCTSIVTIVLGTVLMTMSCEDSTTIKPSNSTGSTNHTKSGSQVGNRITNYTFDGTEGDPISLAIAASWAINYLSQNPLAIKSHFFGAPAIRGILTNSGCVGIRIYYSLDDTGNKQLLLIGADSNGNDLSPASGIKGKASSADLSGGVTDLFTGSEGDLVSAELAKSWMTNYTTRNPASLIAHFFGFEILNQILNQNGCIGIRMYYALNDSGVQQVLLVGVNNRSENILPSLLTGGKVADDGTIGDVSFPCPTYCSGGG